MATSTETEYTEFIQVARSQYFAKIEEQVSNYRFKEDFASSEDVTSPLSSDKAAVSSLKDEESSHGRSPKRYWAKESFTVNNKKGIIKDAVTSSDTAN